MRNAFAQTICELAREDERIIVLVADISPAGAMEEFRREFPRRFINVGVAEQAMIGVAAGLAQRGYRPFCYTIAAFALFRAYEFIRCDLAYQDLPVTVVGMGAGLSYPTLGGTHQAVEDVAVAMACPNLTVLAPCDPGETAECVRWCAALDSGGPVYLRIGKAGEPDLTTFPPWHIDEPRWLRGGLACGDACIVTYGPIASEALRVDEAVAGSVVSFCTLPPPGAVLDDIMSLFKRVLFLEEASGAPLYKWALAQQPDAWSKVCSLALPREFPHAYGTRDELLARAGLTADAITRKFGGGL